MKNLALILTFFGIAGALSACNTVSGMGEDVQKVGSTVTGASESMDPGR